MRNRMPNENSGFLSPSQIDDRHTLHLESEGGETEGSDGAHGRSTVGERTALSRTASSKT